MRLAGAVFAPQLEIVLDAGFEVVPVLSFIIRQNLAGRPAQTSPGPTILRGETKAPAATIEPLSTTASSMTTADMPTMARSLIVQAWIIAIWPIIT